MRVTVIVWLQVERKLSESSASNGKKVTLRNHDAYEVFLTQTYTLRESNTVLRITAGNQDSASNKARNSVFLAKGQGGTAAERQQWP